MSTAVLLPHNTELSATTVGSLPLSNMLSPVASTAHMPPGISNSFLLSIGQLCDDDCWAILDKHFLHVFKDARLLLKGYRNKLDGL